MDPLDEGIIAEMNELMTRKRAFKKAFHIGKNYVLDNQNHAAHASVYAKVAHLGLLTGNEKDALLFARRAKWAPGYREEMNADFLRDHLFLMLRRRDVESADMMLRDVILSHKAIALAGDRNYDALWCLTAGRLRRVQGVDLELASRHFLQADQIWVRMDEPNLQWHNDNLYQWLFVEQNKRRRAQIYARFVSDEKSKQRKLLAWIMRYFGRFGVSVVTTAEQLAA